MRQLTDTRRLRLFMAALAEQAEEPTGVYFAGGATAVLIGWRETTIDADVRIEPERDELLRILPELKERLEINVELASPADFIPVDKNWKTNSTFIEVQSNTSFYHFDIYAQALSKIERGHNRDVADLDEMLKRGLLEPAKVLSYFEKIEPELYRFPAIDPKSFRDSVVSRFGNRGGIK